MNNENRASCIECGEHYKVPSESTTGIRGHLRTKHKTIFETLEAREARAKARSTVGTVDTNSDSDNDFKVGTSSGDGASRAATITTSSRKRSRKDKMRCEEIPTKRVFTKSPWSKNDDQQKEVVAAMIQWIASAMLPFNIVDNDEFIYFVKVCTKGQYKPISSRTISRTKIPILYNAMKAAVDNKLNEDKPHLDGISFTSDLWTNKTTNAAYIAMTVHYIDSDFQMKRFLVTLQHFAGKHSSEEIAKRLDSITKDLNLGPNVRTTITCDGGANMKKAGKDCVINDVFWCVDHKINLIVQSAASKCKLWRDLSDKMTGLVSFFNHSQKSKDSLIAEASKNPDITITKIVQSCSTRWNSDLYQLQSINELLPAIKIVAEKDVSQNLVNKLPDEEEIEQLRTMIELLKKFEELSHLASAENEVSIVHVIPKLFDLEDELQSISHDSPNPMMKEVVDHYLLEMNDRFPECGAQVLEYAYANMLDPRYKGSTLHGIGQRYHMTKVSLQEAVFNMCKAELKNTPSPHTSQSSIDDIQQDTNTHTATKKHNNCVHKKVFHQFEGSNFWKSGR